VRQPAAARKRTTEKRFGGSNISLGAQEKIDGLSSLVDCSVKICPTAFVSAYI
jgi:hypothetical protein